ncbi:MAG TPA: DoxX family membrane protein, partial [Candidatus Angelobacter sp.]|nr:DoxX family membrane protein [Candidatus Angelobacter sp.]
MGKPTMATAEHGIVCVDWMILLFPQLANFSAIVFLLMRLMVAAIFVASGWSHLKDPEARGKSIGMSKGFTVFLGAVELAGALGVAFGVLT